MSQEDLPSVISITEIQAGFLDTLDQLWTLDNYHSLGPWLEAGEAIYRQSIMAAERDGACCKPDHKLLSALSILINKMKRHHDRWCPTCTHRGKLLAEE